MTIETLLRVVNKYILIRQDTKKIFNRIHERFYVI